jgi:hypothetical protein
MENVLMTGIQLPPYEILNDELVKNFMLTPKKISLRSQCIYSPVKINNLLEAVNKVCCMQLSTSS